jgi:hypothetical protein
MSDKGLSKRAEGALLSPERWVVSVEAALELSQASNALAAMSKDADADICYLLRGMALRMKALSNCILSSLDDELETVEGLAEIVRGGSKEIGEVVYHQSSESVEA